MPEQTKKIDIAVVGGGFGGLAVAIGLQHSPHFNVHVYEGAHKFSEVGAGVVLGPNAQNAMEIIDPRIKQGFERRAAFTTQPPDENGLYTWVSYRKGQAPDFGEHVIDIKNKMKSSTMHRAHFLDELVKLVDPEKAHFGKRLDSVYETDDEDSKLALHFKDGTIGYADILIGADGIHSVVRKHILGPKHPCVEAMFTGTVVYRCIVPTEKVKEKLGYVPAGAAEAYLGQGSMVMHFPLSGGEQYFIGPTAYGIKGWHRDHHASGADLSEVRAKFADWGEEARALVDLMPEDKTEAWAIHDMSPAPIYYKGRCVMMGDAAHASSPHQGSGASQAIEDAAVLTKLLTKYLDPSELAKNGNLHLHTVVPMLFQAYDATRRFRSQKVVTTSREAGLIQSGRLPGQGSTAAAIRKNMEGRYDWIFNHDQTVQVKDAYDQYEALLRAATRTDL